MTNDELYAYELELELRRRQKEKDEPKVEKASTAFEVGSSIRNAIPESVRRPVSSVANVARQPVEFGAMLFDAASAPFTAIDRSLGLDTPWMGTYGAVNEAGDAAFGRPNIIEKLIGATSLGAGLGKVSGAIGPIRGGLSAAGGYLGGEAGSTVGKAAGAAVGRTFGLDEARSALAGEGIGGIGGAIVGGSPSLVPNINTANRLAAQGLKGIGPLSREMMANTQDDLARAGVFSMPSQLDETMSPSLRELQNRTLAANVGNGSLEERIRGILNQARGFAGGMTRSLGAVDDSTRRANEIQDVVERVVNLPRDRARDAARPYYEMLARDRPQLPVEVRFKIANELDDIVEKVGIIERSSAGRAVNRAAKTVLEDSSILNQAGKPFNLANADIYSLDNFVSKDLRVRIENLSKLNSTSKEMVERAGLIPAYKAVRDQLIENSPTLRAAKNAYQRTRNAGLEEVRSTGLPAAKPLNISPGPMTPSATWKQFDTIIEQGNPEDVRRAAALLRGRDNNAFRDITKNWFRRVHEEVFMPGSGNASEPKIFAEKLLSNPNIDAVLEEAAKGLKGVDPTEFAVGFKKAMRLLQAAGRPVKSTSAADIGNIIGSDPAAIAGRFAVVHELGRKAMLASRYFEWAQNKQWQKLYDVLNSPDSMRQLSRMAAMEEMNPRTAAFLSSIVGGTVAVD